CRGPREVRGSGRTASLGGGKPVPAGQNGTAHTGGAACEGPRGKLANQPDGPRPVDGGGAVVHSEFVVDVDQVCLDRGLGNEQFRGDLLVALSAGQQLQQFEFPWTQVGGVGAGLRGDA